MSEYIPNIGDVVLDNGINNVVISMKSYEDVGSCAYDRKYLLCEESYIKSIQGDIRLSDLEQNGRWITVTGVSFPDIQKVGNVAPYNINKFEAYSIKQKVAKTVTIYE